ncbi:DUF192 domain-containing protein [Puniceicoccus vermicola]|uniref:DUF192 domain-containing protein n=1 Tax=Puniceicoccus vermicola TaxID=388746 RepID=A0A7X1B1H9_9BACT|nr:DUF192 domain-containing protein [Puniceicoccus vermicola]MBC2603893.1 DUF192 domain-containing protein [Puniceicoccus vermicola]
MNSSSSKTSGMKRLPAILLLTCCVLLSGCDLFGPSAPESRYFSIPIANRPADLELALTISERQQGLQKRLELGKDEGMAFLFERPQQASFWMKNTEIPLDIGYFTGDGILREIHQMFPNVEVPVKSFRDDIVIAVEMNKGWFRKKGIKPGDSIDLQRLMRAIKARGENPADYALQTSRSLGLE